MKRQAHQSSSDSERVANSDSVALLEGWLHALRWLGNSAWWVWSHARQTIVEILSHAVYGFAEELKGVTLLGRVLGHGQLKAVKVKVDVGLDHVHVPGVGHHHCLLEMLKMIHFRPWKLARENFVMEEQMQKFD